MNSVINIFPPFFILTYNKTPKQSYSLLIIVQTWANIVHINMLFLKIFN